MTVPLKLDSGSTVSQLLKRPKVLDLWRQGQSSTYCIAQALDLPEDEVCAIIDAAEQRALAKARQA
ncbi:hypothetical protein [Rhizobium sp. FKY42]|uniref:hypothetical protein n=1 Tax=Rhizobium sp. FKY42 TaxID=2562310 RepID=UPI0010C04AD3|nr:hypothetical protein [Rhizobium sp. FKY42]